MECPVCNKSLEYCKYAMKYECACGVCIPGGIDFWVVSGGNPPHKDDNITIVPPRYETDPLTEIMKVVDMQAETMKNLMEVVSELRKIVETLVTN